MIDREATRSYKDLYTEPCPCDTCTYFYHTVEKKHPELIEWLDTFGCHPSRAIEVMFDEEEKVYDVFFSVKGTQDVLDRVIEHPKYMFTMHRPESSQAIYTNTGMEAPYLILIVHHLKL